MSSTAEPLPFLTWACMVRTPLTPFCRLVSEDFVYCRYLLAVNRQEWLTVSVCHADITLPGLEDQDTCCAMLYCTDIALVVSWQHAKTCPQQRCVLEQV